MEKIKHEVFNEESDLKVKIKNNIPQEELNKSINNTTITPAITQQSELNNTNVLEDLNKSIKNENSKKERPQNITKVSVITQYKTYLPFVTAKIIISAFFFYKYLVYGIKNIEDQNYCKYGARILAIYILICYYLSTFIKSTQTNVNKYFSEDISKYKIGNPGNEIQNLDPFDYGYCPFCDLKKFIRTSHCRICNKCILMRDHHCPFVVGCIGFKNIQYFFNFVFWAIIGNIYYVVSFIRFMFFSKVKISIPFYIYIFLYLDFFLSCFFVLNISAIMIRLLITAYNNWTQKENMSGPYTENYCPLHSCCINDEKQLGEKREPNFYNIGFLSNFYYLIGPTISHFFFPLPKYKNYTLDENCPIFQGILMLNKFESFRYIVKKDPSRLELLTGSGNSPEYYIQLCHQYYDGKKII